MISTYKIESEAEADSYLNDLLEKREYQSISEVERRSLKLIDDEKLRKYFIKKAIAILTLWIPQAKLNNRLESFAALNISTINA